jgi:hypothetical protein
LEVISPKGKINNPPKHSSLHFKKKGKGEGFWLGGQWKEEEKVLSYVFHFSPKQLYLNLHFLSFTLRFYFALVLGHYLRPPFVFLGL